MDIKPNSHSLQITLTFICFLLLLFSFHGLGSTIYPLVISWILAYMFHPILSYIRKFLPAPVGALIISALLTLLLGTLIFTAIPLLIQELNAFLHQLPNNIESASRFLDKFLQSHNLESKWVHDFLIGKVSSMVKSMNISSITIISQVATTAAAHIMEALTMLINIFLIPIFFFYWSIQNLGSENILIIFPTTWKKHAHYILKQSNLILSGYLRGQSAVILTLMALYSSVLYLLDVHFGVLIGIITGFLQIIPYVGFCIGLTSAIIMGIATETTWLMVSKIAICYLVITNFEGFILTPLLVGNRLGLNTLVTLLAIIIASHYLGIVGIILAIPVTAWIHMCLTYLFNQAKISPVAKTSHAHP
ncbi:MAG TPA: AI-2E family transporter [Gammaproteobacteria bacterium]|nr:AI-2E family transporter [Gammaproteobacteria bacterium]